jgi:hypothetical protein
MRTGHAPNGKQRYLYQECQRYSRECPSSRGYSEKHKEKILRAYQERSSLRGIERTFWVSRYTVAQWLKKAAELPPLSETLVEPDAHDPEATTLELDELWSFVLHKSNKVWIWIALCRKTRHVVARAIGDRREKTCRELWHAIPEIYRSGHCSTDFWHASQVAIPPRATERSG